MFVQCFIVQCRSSGEFLTVRGSYTRHVSMAGIFLNRQEARDTAINEFETDYIIFDFYKKDTDLPVLAVGVRA